MNAQSLTGSQYGNQNPPSPIFLYLRSYCWSQHNMAWNIHPFGWPRFADSAESPPSSCSPKPTAAGAEVGGKGKASVLCKHCSTATKTLALATNPEQSPALTPAQPGSLSKGICICQMLSMSNFLYLLSDSSPTDPGFVHLVQKYKAY